MVKTQQPLKHGEVLALRADMTSSIQKQKIITATKPINLNLLKV